MFRQFKLLALAASLVGAVALSGCGGGFGGSGGAEGSGSPILDSGPSPEKIAVAAGDDISAEEGRKVAETVSRLNLGLGGDAVSPEDVRVSHHRAVLDRDPFSASSGVPAARKLGVATTRSLRGRGYKAFEFPVPAESPIMTVAVWISETPPPDQKAPDPKTPGGKTDAPAKTIYVRLQVFISPAKLGLAGSDAMVQDLETQEVAVQVKTPKPKPTCAAGEVLDSRWNVCVSLRPADNVCPGGTLPAGGRTQAELNAGLRAAARGGDADAICEWLRRGADIGDTQGGAEWSVLHEAVSEEHPAAAALLLANDADVNFRKEGEGWSPLDIAVRKENAEIAALLRGAGGLCFLETGPLCSDPSSPSALVTVSFSWSGLGTIWAESGGVRLFSGDLVPQDARVTFRAVGAAGHYAQLFAVYGGDCVKAAGGGLDCVAGSGVANLSSSARFVPHRSAPEIPKVAVNFSASGLGFGTISAQSGGDFLSSGDEVPQGATVIFTAVPLPGHYVSGWGGACADSYFADGLDGSAKECRLMADAALSVEAEFSAVPSLSGPLCPAGSLSANGMTQAALDAGLISAAEANDLSGACEWLRRGANVEARESSREFLRTGLMIAAGGGFLELAKLLHANGADVNLAGGSHGRSPRAISDITPGWTALHYAATAGHADMVSWLLDAGAAIDALWTRGGKTALWEAAAYGRIDAVAVLLSRGADVVRKEGYRGTTPLHAATWLKLANFEDNFVMASYPPVPQGEGSDVALVSLILSYSAEVNARSDNGWSALDYAANQGRARIAEVLRNAGGRCFVQSGPLCGVPAAVTAETVCAAGTLPANGMTQAGLDAGLLSAAEANDLSGACEWLRRGADADARESGRYYGRTALMIAANDGFLELARLLHANGADVNLGGGNHDGHLYGRGWSALHYAAAAGHAEMARWLLNSGAVLDMVWHRGKTALWEAAYWGRPAVVGLLLSRGANKETNYDGGSTPLHAAVEEGWFSARKWVASPFRYKRMAISYSYPHPTAAEHAVVMSLLLSAGSEVNVRRRGLSPLDSAARSGNALFAGILREHGGVCFVETGPLCGVPAAAVTAETVCAAGSLSANGMSQAALDAGLISAAEANDLSGACEWLRRGADADARESGRYYGRTALMIAANDGFLGLAKLLHANGADVNLGGGNHDGHLYGRGWSALHYAAAAGYAEMAEWLLNSGAVLDMVWHRGKTALWEAAYWGRPAVVGLLLSRGANKETNYDGGSTPLHAAVEEGEGWVSARKWVASPFRYKRMAISYSYPHPTAAEHAVVMSLLLSAGSEVNVRRRGLSPLDSAARSGNALFAGILREHGGVCFVETGPLCGEVPATAVTAETICAAGSLPANGMTQAALDQGLIAAALENDLEGVCENLRRGANVNAEKRVARGVMETALIVAASYGRMELARLLIRNGAEVNLGGEHSRWRKDRITPLMAASGLGRLAMAEFLISQGAEIDAVDTRGRGALYEAAHSGRWAIVEMLLARGADANLQEGWGETPLYGALVGWDGYGQEGYAVETLNWVRERGATRNPDGIASWVKVINALLAGGADANLQRTTHNWAGPGRAAALDYAARLGHSEFARILREADGKCFVEAGPLCGDEMVAVELSASGWGLFYAQSSGRGGSMFFEQGEVMRGATVIFTAAPSAGHYVSAWGGECAGAAGAAVLLHATLGGASDAASKTCALVATQALNVNAVFAAVPVAGPGPVTILATVANTVVVETLSCPAGSLPANGLTQAELNLTLRAAARGGDSAGVCEALRRGAEVNDDQGGTEFTPLQEAVYGGHLAAAEILLANGAEVNARKEGLGPSPLDLAAKDAKEEIARVLRAAGGRCFLETGPLCGGAPVAGPGAVTILATVGVTVAVVEPVTIATPDPVTILATVGVVGNSCPAGTLPADGLTQAELNQGLLDEVRDAGDNGNWDGRKRTEICEWIRRGADINSYVPYDATTDSSSGMPLLYAAWSTPLGDSRDNSHFSEIVEFLIANGADVNKRSGGREWPVPLFAAPKSRGMVFGEGEEHVEIEEITGILLRNGADVHVTNEYGRTALLNVIYRFQSWNSGVVKMLLDAGSDPDAKDNEEDAALHRLARGGDFPDMAELLLRRGADVNVRDSYDDTPLHYVVRKRERDYSSYGSEVRMSLMVVLLEHGADVSAINSFGETPLRIARGRKWSRYSDADERQWYSAVVDLMEAALPSPTVVLESRSVPVSEDGLAEALRGRFANAFNAGPAFGDSFGAVAGSSGGLSGGLLSRLDGVMRGGVSAKEDWASFSGWQQENGLGRLWFSTRHRGDFGFGAGGGGMGGAVDGSPFAAISGNGLLAGGEMALGSGGSERLRFAAFGDLQSRSLLSGEERRWTDWAASGTAIETAMAEAERLSGAADNRTRGALTEIHLGDSVGGSGLAFQAGALSESESLLSGTSRGEDLRGLRSRTAFAGVSGSADLFGGGGWRVRGAAHVGRSWAESSGVLRSGDLWASSFSAGLERGGWLYSGDGVMFRISQPLRVESWEMDLMEGGEVRRLLVSPSGRQLDLDAAYRLPLSGGWLLLSAGVRRGSGHVGSSGLEGGALFSLERDF